VLAQLEENGFCKPGEAEAFVGNGGLEVGGRLPNNTSGGPPCEGHTPGMSMVIENVRQLRGTACNQVNGAEIAFVCGAISDPSGAVLLGVDR